jgi:hypothetical protein
LTYDIKDKITLTEDRTAKYSHEITRSVAKALLEVDDESLLERVLTLPDGIFEKGIDFDYSHYEPSACFMKVCARLYETKNIEANHSAIELYKKRANLVGDGYEVVELDECQQKMLDRARELLALAGFNVQQYPISVVKTLGTGVLGLAKDGTVFISRSCFDRGTKYVAHALLEETWHLEYGFEDETRAFQTFLFQQILTMTERSLCEVF